MKRNKNTCVECSKSRTSAWADIDHVKDETHVPIPSLLAVEEAKAWVEENQK